MSEAKTSVDKVKTNVAGGETTKTTTASSKGKSINDKKDKGVARVIRNFTYELNDVEGVFTSKISFFLEELNKQINALVSSSIYTENKEKLDKVLKSKGEFRKELLRLLKTERSYTDFYQKYYFDAEIFGNKAKYFRTVIEEYRRILLSRLQRQTIIDMIVNNPTITYQEVFNKLCELNEQRSSKNSDYKFNWISKAEFNNIIKQLSNLNNLSELNKLSSLDNLDNSTSEDVEQAIDVYAIDYSSEDDQISEFNLTDNDEYYLIEFKLKYSDYTTKSDSLLTYQCQVPKKQIKGLTTGYTKLKKFTRPKIFLKYSKLYISFNYELLVNHQHSDSVSEQSIGNKNISTEAGSDSVATWHFKTMGIDIGVAKSATAAIMTTNMCWQHSEANSQTSSEASMADKQAKLGGEEEKPASVAAELVATIDFKQPVIISNELTISDKTKAVSAHIEILKEEQNHIYKKEKAIYDLLKLKQFDGYASNVANSSHTSVNASYVDGLVNHVKQQLAKLNDTACFDASPTLDLLDKYQRLNKLRLHLRHKVSNLKKELSFLTARDMISHAIDNEVDLITMEKLSWIKDVHHTTWDYSQIQQRIIHEANIYGIKVKKVACAYSSKHNPLNLEEEEVDQNRKLVKCLFDRDYAAAIILARRGIKLGKRKLKLSPSCEAASHINESFHAVNLSIKPSLNYRQLKLCAKRQKSIICDSSETEASFAYYSIL